jgi:hypothetical protein
MSREVRRVPVGWQHPTVADPYWREQAASQLARQGVLSLLHMPQVRLTVVRGGAE